MLVLVKIISSISLEALAYIIGHELGHIYLNHETAQRSEQQELDANTFAKELLANLGIRAPEKVER
jgi:Zn-dependent peptidase ImmA (M78 family)